MKTYNDLIAVGENEKERLDFVRECITQHESSELYKTAKIANDYMSGHNTTITNLIKTLVTKTGRVVEDKWSPNHKTASKIFNRFVTQQNQYLLGNGIMWKDKSTAEKLGADFDLRVMEAGAAALTGAVSFGFWNNDHLEVFPVAGTPTDPTFYVPLYDENNGAMRAGVRYWSLDNGKPLRATLYEENGYTEYIWNRREGDGKVQEDGSVLQPKRPYKLKVATYPTGETEIYEGENYPTFPIVPLYGNKLHQSEIVGLQEKIDAYDMMQNGLVNELDNAQIYWIIKNANGADNEELAQFLDQLRSMHAANTDEQTDAQPVTIDVPYAARETILNRLERQLYKDYQALDPDAIAGGAATATQIKAAYEPMETKSCEYEACILDFLYKILDLAGIKGEKPTFTRTRIFNTAEEVQTVVMAAAMLSPEYVTRKILTLLGDGDKADEIIAEAQANEIKKMQQAMALGLQQAEGDMSE